MDIIVLCGGLSTERDVSINSGTMIAAALRRLGHRAVLVDLFFGYRYDYDDPSEIFSQDHPDGVSRIGEDVPDIEAIKASRQQDNDSRIGSNVIDVCRAADLVFIALHGEDGEDGKIQAVFDLEGIKYTGTGHLGSGIAMNKWISKQLFDKSGIPTPPGICVNRYDTPYANVGFPCVVKPRNGGSSVGTSIVNDESEYLTALEASFTYEDDAIVEKYIKGRECDVAVLDGRALPVIEICPKSGFFDYKNKYQDGMTDEYCPADLDEAVTERLQKAAVDVYNALMLDVYARMDFMIDEQGGIWCLEANTLPGMTPASLMPKEAAAAGISYEQLCSAIIDVSLRKYDGGNK